MATAGNADELAHCDRVARAAEHHRAGRLAEAEALCREILAAEPRQHEAINLLAAIAWQTGHHAAALDLFARAAEVQPGAGHYHHNFGIALQGLGRLEEAAQAFERAAALLPASAEILNGLAVLYLLLGRNAQAAAWFEKVLVLHPDAAEVVCNLAVALQNQGLTDPAIERFEQALRLRPDYADAARNLGVALRQQGRLAEALEALERAYAIRPDDAAIEMLVAERHNFGTRLFDQGRVGEATDQYGRALELCPSSAETWYELGRARAQLGQADASRDCYERTVALRPDFANAINSLAMARKAVGEIGPALDLLDRAMALKPDDPEIELNRGLTRLLVGEFQAGWDEYEARWRTEQTAASRRIFDMPLWDGSDGGGRTILLWPEQGLGDTLQFCRYAPLLAERGWSVVLEGPAPLARLLRSLPGVSIVPIGSGAKAHCHSPLLSLPRLFGTTLETIPARVPYLVPPPDELKHWDARLAKRLGMTRSRLKIGLTWAGTPGLLSKAYMAVDAQRSIPLDRLSPLLATPDVTFVSLQKEARPGEDATRAGLVDVMSDVEDFAATAAIIAHLDLVISVDTSVVHLAGALGKPVWLLNRFDPCWRWLLLREDSPWYPTLRQFRQPAPGDWDSVVASVEAALAMQFTQLRSEDFA